MANITDTQLRGIVLRKAYEKRREQFFAWSNDDFKDLDPTIDFDLQDLFRACEQLAQNGLIEFKSVSSGNQILDGRVTMLAAGVDVIEGNTKPPISITYDQSHHVNVTSSSNVQVGNSNIQNLKISVDALKAAIDSSSASDAEKAEAKGLLSQFLGHPLVSAIVGGVVSNMKP